VLKIVGIYTSVQGYVQLEQVRHHDGFYMPFSELRAEAIQKSSLIIIWSQVPASGGALKR
jgi:hypothetical protein